MVGETLHQQSPVKQTRVFRRVSPANSLFRSILPVSPCASIFWRQPPRSHTCNWNGIIDLQRPTKKLCDTYPPPHSKFGICNGLLSLALCDIIGPTIPWGCKNVRAHLWRKTLAVTRRLDHSPSFVRMEAFQ